MHAADCWLLPKVHCQCQMNAKCCLKSGTVPQVWSATPLYTRDSDDLGTTDQRGAVS